MSVNKPNPQTKSVTKEKLIVEEVFFQTNTVTALFIEIDNNGAKTGDSFTWASDASHWNRLRPLAKALRDEIETIRAEQTGGTFENGN